MTRFTVFVLSLFGLISCSDSVIGTYKNENIDAEVLNEIRSLDAQIVEHLRDRDSTALIEMMSDDLRASTGEGLGTFLTRAERILESGAFTTIDQYHRVGTAAEQVAAISGTQSANDYILKYQSLTDESFVSVLAPKREGDTYLLTTFYGLYDGEWKLNILQFERYTIGGASAIELYQMAEQELAQGHVVDAFNRMLLVQGCLHPAGDFWEFRIESEIIAFNDSLAALAQQTFPMPMTLTEVATQPVIFQITPQRVDNEICTMIKYVSGINIADTTALSAENKMLHERCLNVFKGIGEDAPFVFYRAFNQMPTEEVSSPYFGFVRPLDERFL